MRNTFDSQLEELNTELILMGALCEDAISSAITALLENNDAMAKKVLSVDSEIDAKERDIENMCMKLLLRQQPIAKDLRTVSSALKMISDMERIGDQAADIAEIIPFLPDNELKQKLHLRNMAYAVIAMVTESVDSFVKKDLAIAEKVIADDDQVDELFTEIKGELIDLISSGGLKSDGEFFVDILMIAKYLERIGDHATNIAEWVVYSITGRHVDE